MILKKIKEKMLPTANEQKEQYLLQYKPAYPNVKSIDETIDALVNTEASIARFGDGEYLLMSGKSIDFQKYSRQIQKKLLEVMNSNCPNCLIGIIEYKLTGMTPYTRDFWFENIYRIIKLFKRNTFYNARISWELSHERINKLKKIWEGKDIIFVTGKDSEFNVNHELFNNKNSAQNVYGLPNNAFFEYDSLSKAIIDVAKSISNPIVILSLGPTASILAYDLATKGIRSLDLGHITNIYDKSIKAI